MEANSNSFCHQSPLPRTRSPPPAGPCLQHGGAARRRRPERLMAGLPPQAGPALSWGRQLYPIAPPLTQCALLVAGLLPGCDPGRRACFGGHPRGPPGGCRLQGPPLRQAAARGPEGGKKGATALQPGWRCRGLEAVHRPQQPRGRARGGWVAGVVGGWAFITVHACLAVLLAGARAGGSLCCHGDSGWGAMELGTAAAE